MKKIRRVCNMIVMKEIFITFFVAGKFDHSPLRLK